MDFAAKHEIDRFDKQQIPWRRMFTAYGTAENDCEYLSVLEQTLDVQEWKKTFRKLSDFEHQSTFFPPAPFALVFLVRILQKRLQDRNADEIVELLTDATVKDLFRHDPARKAELIPEGYEIYAAAFFGYPGPSVKDRGERKGTVEFK